jgi:hypothetical protein
LSKYVQYYSSSRLALRATSRFHSVRQPVRCSRASQLARRYSRGLARDIQGFMGKAAVAVTGLMVLGVGSAGAVHYGLGRVVEEIRQDPGFAAAWSRAERHPALIRAIGIPTVAPLSLREYLAGRQRWDVRSSKIDSMEKSDRGVRSVRSERRELEAPIRGPRGRGQLTVHAAETPGQGWTLRKLEARIEGRSTPLDLLGDPSP